MEKQDYKNIWVHMEHDGKQVHPVSLEMCCEARKLCDASGEKLIAVVPGALSQTELDKVAECGVDGFLMVSGAGYERYNTEAYTNLYTVLCEKYKPSSVFVGNTASGRDFGPRFAARLETGCMADALEAVYDPETMDIDFAKPASGGKVMVVITIPERRPQVATVRPGTFDYVPAGRKEQIEIIEETVNFTPAEIRTELLGFQAETLDPELDIANCDTLICVGNGLKDEASLARYRELAKLLNAKLAGTRPIIDREYLPYKLQVGQSGTMVKPKLYIGFGISGAMYHVAGVSADMFIAVNNDPEAAIFNYCDYGIVGDMDEVCDAMIAALKTK